MLEYLRAELEVVTFDAEDVITTSGIIENGGETDLDD